jgi:hypothetical protein
MEKILSRVRKLVGQDKDSCLLKLEQMLGGVAVGR